NGLLSLCPSVISCGENLLLAWLQQKRWRKPNKRMGGLLNHVPRRDKRSGLSEFRAPRLCRDRGIAAVIFSKTKPQCSRSSDVPILRLRSNKNDPASVGLVSSPSQFQRGHR